MNAKIACVVIVVCLALGVPGVASAVPTSESAETPGAPSRFFTTTGPILMPKKGEVSTPCVVGENTMLPTGIRPLATSARIQVGGVIFDWSDLFSVRGFAINSGTLTAENIQGTLAFFDGQGRKTGSYPIGAVCYQLGPKYYAPFEFTGDSFIIDQAYSCSVSFTGTITHRFAQGLSVEVAEPYSDYGTVHLSATWENQDPYTYSEAMGWAMVWDKSTGGILAVRAAQLGNSGGILPGDSGSFQLDMVGAARNWSTSGYAMRVVGNKVSPVTPVSRVYGIDRYRTAAAAVREAFADGSSKVAIVVSGAKYPDALSASGLAAAFRAPILLTTPDKLSSYIPAELTRLGVEHVYIVGGTTTVSSLVEQAVRASLAETSSVERIAGVDRYATCGAVLRTIKEATGAVQPTEAFVATGGGFADALSVSPYAWSQCIPVVLVRPDGVSGSVSSAVASLGLQKVWIVGDSKAVGDSVAASFGVPWSRLSGANRYATAVSVLLAARDQGWTDAKTMGLASGVAFPDALSAGPALGCTDSAILLTPPESLAYGTVEGIYRAADAIENLRVFGSSAAISEFAKNQARELCR
jgi:putative cell wall-binding protein